MLKLRNMNIRVGFYEEVEDSTTKDKSRAVQLWTDPISNAIYRQLTMLEILEMIHHDAQTHIENCPECKAHAMIRIPPGYALLFEKNEYEPNFKSNLDHLQLIDDGFKVCLGCFRRENPLGSKSWGEKKESATVYFFRRLRQKDAQAT